MSYNFVDDPSPTMPTLISPTSGDLEMEDGSSQGDWLTSAFSGSSVTVTITPPSGWTINSVEWDNGAGNGTFDVPSLGQEETHTFEVEVIQGTETKSETGDIKIKNAGGTSGPP